MADIRIKVAKDKAKLVKALRAGEGSTGPFQTYVEVLIFAASLGLKQGRYSPFEEFSKKDPDPIPGEHFLSRGASQIIDLIAISHSHEPNTLSEANAKTRFEIFEFYANGGLEIIQDLVVGSSDFQKQIQLFLSMIRDQNQLEVEDSLDFSFL